jgi:[acyl-carrier-protein] S-malonyltransferase
MNRIDFKPPAIPILFNVTADQENDTGNIRRIMANQIASRVRWFEIIQKLVAADVRIFIEVGPKTVLSGLLRKIVPKGYECQRFQVDSPEKVQKVVEALNT